PHGVHVGLVVPGFIATEGFPATELRSRWVTRWMVSDAESAANAIVDAGLRRRVERYVPRPYAIAAAARVLAPALLRRGQRARAGGLLTPRTGADIAGVNGGQRGTRTLDLADGNRAVESTELAYRRT